MIKFNEQTGEIKVTNSTSSQTTSDKWKEYQDWLNEVPEISDEDIEKAAKEWYDKKGIVNYKAEIRAWVSACKWYREQLKSRVSL